MTEDRLARRDLPQRPPRRRGHAALAFGRDQLAHTVLGGADAFDVGQPLAVQRLDIEPGAHRHAAIERHRTHRRVREDEADAGVRGQAQFADDGHEVMAVGAQAMQPDHAGTDLAGGLDDDGMFGFDEFHGNQDEGRSIEWAATLMDIRRGRIRRGPRLNVLDAP